MKSFKKNLVIFITGLGVGAILFGLITSLKNNQPLDDVKTTRVSGADISHKDFKYSESKISFRTEAAGKGVAITEIPKKNIPEARAWLNYVNGISGTITVYYSGYEWENLYNLTYWRRFGRFSLGTGINAGANKIGVTVGGMYWF